MTQHMHPLSDDVTFLNNEVLNGSLLLRLVINSRRDSSIIGKRKNRNRVPDFSRSLDSAEFSKLFFLSANFFDPNSKGTINFGVRAEYFHIFKVRDFQKDSSTDCSAFLIKSPFSFRMPVVCNPLSVIRGDESA